MLQPEHRPHLPLDLRRDHEQVAGLAPGDAAAPAAVLQALGINSLGCFPVAAPVAAQQLRAAAARLAGRSRSTALTVAVAATAGAGAAGSIED